MENISMRMILDEEKDIMKLMMGIKFNSMSELSKAIKTLDDAQKMNANSSIGQLRDNSMAEGANNILENVNFSFNGQSFSRSFISENKEKIDLKSINKEIDQLKGMKEFFTSMTYSVKYNFPKKKKITNKKAKLSNGKKSVGLTVNFLDLMQDPTILNLDVQLK